MKSFMKKLSRPLVAATLVAASGLAQAANVLVVLSDTDTLELKAGKTFSTGFYLNETMQPVKMLLDAGHQLTFVTPSGRAPTSFFRSRATAAFGNLVLAFMFLPRCCQRAVLPPVEWQHAKSRSSPAKGQTALQPLASRLL